MLELLDTHASKLRVVAGSMLILASLGFLCIMITTAKNNQVAFALPPPGAANDSALTAPYSSPNAVASSMSKVADTATQTIDSLERTVSNTFQSAVSSAAAAGKSVSMVTLDAGKAVGAATVKSGKFVARHTYRGIAFAGTAVGHAAVFTVQIPIKVAGFAGDALSSNSLVRPADNATTPVIDSQLATLYASYPKLSEEELAARINDQDETEALWPIRGRVTTRFGVPHRPYQVTHTGLDISSGQRSGVTAVKPFRAGQVLSVVRSKQGLGNHIVVDHGGGLTSVYAHLYSISVQENQTVDTGTVLGLEGSTGVSTGTHLHFEIRLNGQPVDPKQYITGHP